MHSLQYWDKKQTDIKQGNMIFMIVRLSLNSSIFRTNQMSVKASEIMWRDSKI